MSLLDGARLRPSGETALVVEFGEVIDPGLHGRVLALDAAVRAAPPRGVLETVPTYRSLTVHLDALLTTPGEVGAALAVLAPVPTATTDAREQHTVPVTFDGEDLAAVARRTDRSPGDVVALLTTAVLRVYMHGFAPGFAYLGGVPDTLHLPRRTTPREPVTPGAVLLAAGQAAFCPVAMPTGWWCVGHTDLPLFDPSTTPPVPFAAGDRVRLVAVGP